MKTKAFKILSRVLLVLVVFSIAGYQFLRADTVMLSFSYGYLLPADSGYKEVYGNSVQTPEFKLGFRVFRDFYLYGTFFSVSKSGLTPELNEPAHSKQQFFGGGVGFSPYLNRFIKAFLGAGVAMATYEETAMDIKVSGNKMGFLVEAGVYFKEKFLILGLNGSYCTASDTYEDVNFKIGGTRASVLLGFIF
ncbi:MAG: hypothetical protein QME28_08560 [Candidatus Saccharicenans sp.]|nr:hypothetical protein [Candidatus Saccharicenans sp.]